MTMLLALLSITATAIYLALSQNDEELARALALPYVIFIVLMYAVHRMREGDQHARRKW